MLRIPTGDGHMQNESTYKYLGPKLGSSYKQLYVKGRRIRAESLYRETLDPDGRTPEQVAEDYEVPIEAVRESIEYCKQNWDLILQEWEEEETILRAAGHLPPRANGRK